MNTIPFVTLVIQYDQAVGKWRAYCINRYGTIDGVANHLDPVEIALWGMVAQRGNALSLNGWIF